VLLHQVPVLHHHQGEIAEAVLLRAADLAGLGASRERKEDDA